MKTFIILYFCLIATMVCGQSPDLFFPVPDSLKCGYDPDSALARQIKELILKGKSQHRVHKTERVGATLYTIPVVVHVIEDNDTATIATDAQVHAIIANLNDAYNGAGFYAGSPDVQIAFELAKYGPDCAFYPDGAINRFDASDSVTYASRGVLGEGVTSEQVRQWVTWDKSLYLNIWMVSRMNNGVAGLGSAGTGVLGSASQMRRAHDYVTPHEVGHFLGLAHPFPSLPDCGCGDGDGLEDTPPLISNGIGNACEHNSGCSDALMALINPCTNEPYGLIQKNIMNYISSACDKLFSNDQVDAMRYILETYHATLLTSPVLGDAPPAAAAAISAPDAFCTLDGFPVIKMTCICSEKSSITRNGTVIAESQLGTKPLPGAGNTSVWNYTLTCSNGLTTSRSVTFYNPGIKSISTQCAQAEDVWTASFENPGNYVITTSAGEVSGSSIINIPFGTAPTVSITDAEGCGNSITVAQPCCAVRNTALPQCLPVAANGLSDYFGLTNFTLGTINRTSGNSASDGANYLDRTCTDISNVSAGSEVPFSVRAFYTNRHQIKVYVDFNNDGAFTADGQDSELVFQGRTPGGADNTLSGHIAIPAAAVRNVPLRVRVLADQASTSDACTIIGQNTGRILVNYGSGQIEDFSITVNGALPVTLVSFQGKEENGLVKLDWQTSQEMQNRGFEVQRSDDARSFAPQGFVPGQHTSDQPARYSFLDSRITPGKDYYYRLKQLDMDDSFAFSRTIAVQASKYLRYVYPNPVDGDGQFRVVFQNPEDHELSIVSVTGTQVAIETSLSQEPQGWIVKTVEELAPGLYTVRIRSKADGTMQYLKMIAY